MTIRILRPDKVGRPKPCHVCTGEPQRFVLIIGDDVHICSSNCFKAYMKTVRNKWAKAVPEDLQIDYADWTRGLVD